MVAKKGPHGTTSALVVSAIRKLRDVQGTSSREIVNFISAKYEVAAPTLKRHVQMALRRGMSYGIIHKAKGGYSLSNPKELSLSCDTLVDRSRGGRCGRKKRRRSRGCRPKKSRCAKKRRSMRCAKKRPSCGRRKAKKRCGGRRHATGEDEMDEMVMSLGRRVPRKSGRIGRSKFQDRSRTRSKSPSDRSSMMSSAESTPLDNPSQL